MLISFVIPAYNVEPYIARCINSILAIDRNDIEILIINDGSTDNTAIECQKYSDSRIKLFNKRNGGVSSARNYGIREAHGKYICFIDGDDFVNSYVMEQIISEIDGQSELIMFGFSQVGEFTKDVFPVVDAGVYYDRSVQTELISRMTTPVLNKHDAFRRIEGKVFQYFFSTNLLKTKYELNFDERIPYAEDLCFLVSTLKRTERIQVIHKIAYNYSIRSGSAAYSYRDNISCELFDVYEYIKKENVLSKEATVKYKYYSIMECVFHYTKWLVDRKDIIQKYREIQGKYYADECAASINIKGNIRLKTERFALHHRAYTLLLLVEKMRVFKRSLKVRDRKYI